ncbi:MAG: NYN domain-containing protein [Candidatus Eisenbacteria bacterium]|nr:NYN domain-containing protein [Candidatus Eisenbacteria bacterium]
MPREPGVKRAMAFVDGQNLFHAAREAFGHRYPNFDPVALARSVCLTCGWELELVSFYTGMPDPADDPFWNHFWSARVAYLGAHGVRTFTRPLRYRVQEVRPADTSVVVARIAQEKGIDVRLALDVVRYARDGHYDVGLVFSQDQDLAEAADEVRRIARQQDRWIKVACAFPLGPGSRNRRGINHTDWIPIEHATYDACLDPRDYRPRRG